MKLLFVYLFCLPLILSCGPDADLHLFTISAYNMYLFFDGTDDGWEYDGFRKSDGYTQERYLDRVKDTAVFIARNMDSDVIILSEVESAVVLNDLL